MKMFNPNSWITLIIGGYSQHIFKLLMPLLILMAVYSTLIVLFFQAYFDYNIEGTLAIHMMLGVVLGLFLVLRTNTAYDRWWEGRKLWGQLVNDSRALAIKLSVFIPKEHSDELNFFGRMIINQAKVLKEHLRDSHNLNEIELTDEEKHLIADVTHRPIWLNNLMYQKITGLLHKKIITGEQLLILDKELKGYMDVVGACERIKRTPIPHSYSMFIKKFIFVYLVTIPFGFVHQFGYFTVPLVLVVFYFLVSIELISEEIEDPFGNDINDLPLDTICATIERNIKEMIPKS